VGILSKSLFMGKYDEFMKKTSNLQNKFLYQNRRSFNT